jgi:hypothetical protein
VLSAVILHDTPDGVHVELVGKLTPPGQHDVLEVLADAAEDLDAGRHGLGVSKPSSEPKSVQQPLPYCTLASLYWSPDRLKYFPSRRRAESAPLGLAATASTLLHPAWRSPLLPVGVRSPFRTGHEAWTFDRCAQVLRAEATLLPNGSRLSHRSYGRLCRGRSDLPSETTVYRRVVASDLTLREFYEWVNARSGTGPADITRGPNAATDAPQSGSPRKFGRDAKEERIAST